MYVTGLGGAAALSNAASASSAPLSASSYQARTGPAFQFAAGYHFTDWVSVQAFYSWNQNEIRTSRITQSALAQTSGTAKQHAVGGEGLLYFRARSSWVRPYLSGGPAWVRVDGENKLGFRTAVGVDIQIRTGLQLRYSFSEMMSANSFANTLSPSTGGLLMNFQNIVGFVKTF